MIRYLICACGETFAGNKARHEYHAHKKTYKGIITQEEFITRTEEGRLRVEKVLMSITKEEEQWKHIKAEFILLNGAMLPVDSVDAERVNERSRVFDGNAHNENFDVLRDAPLRLLYQTKLNSKRNGYPSYTVCLNCDFKAGGEYSGSWGAFHACGTRHRVIFYSAKRDMINLMEVPVRRCKARKGYKEEDYAPMFTFKQQQNFPPDIDPYRHPVYRYSKCPKQDHINYREHMRKNASTNAFPIIPWVDPYRERYKAVLNKTKEELIENDSRI